MSLENIVLCNQAIDAFNRRDLAAKKAVWWDVFGSEAEALEAVGLSEYADV